MVNPSIFGSFGDVAGLEVADLEGRVLQVTSDGISWRPCGAPNLSLDRLLELYYYMRLTRAVDREIVKLLRKGLAFGNT